MPRRTLEITSIDVPQAPNLARIRCVLASIADGAATVEQIAEETDISTRHIGYAVRAAQTLGMLDAERAPTDLGRTLLATEQESDEERAAFRSAIEGNAVLRAIAPGLLGKQAPVEEDARRPHREADGARRGDRPAPRERSARLARADRGGSRQARRRARARGRARRRRRLS